jgi:hypothetical protein
MSNHLAIAAVTATLRRQLQSALDGDVPLVPNAKVTSVRPSAPSGDLPSPGVNVFLYQVTPNTALRNADLPTRDGSGAILRRPTEALDLHYILSFYGDDKKLEPQRLLGSTVRALHSQPVLTRDMVQAMLADPLFSFLAGSDLPEAIERLRITPTSFSLEEMSKLWSIFLQTPYVLAVAYSVSVVGIAAELEPREALPVRSTRVRAEASLPIIERILSRPTPAAPAVPGTPILAGHILVLEGRQLLASVTRVKIADLEVAPAAEDSRPDQLSVPLPAGLPAGLQPVRVIQRRDAAPSPLDIHSNTAAFVLQPEITAQVVGSAIRVGFSPPVGRAQRVTLFLNEIDAPPTRPARAHSFEAPLRDTPPTAPSLDIAFQDVQPGDYLVRVRVGDAESPLELDPATGRYSAPRVTIP